MVILESLLRQKIYISRYRMKGYIDLILVELLQPPMLTLDLPWDLHWVHWIWIAKALKTGNREDMIRDSRGESASAAGYVEASSANVKFMALDPDMSIIPFEAWAQ